MVARDPVEWKGFLELRDVEPMMTRKTNYNAASLFNVYFLSQIVNSLKRLYTQSYEVGWT